MSLDTTMGILDNQHTTCGPICEVRWLDDAWIGCCRAGAVQARPLQAWASLVPRSASKSLYGIRA